MNWYKIELTEEQLENKIDVIIEQKLENNDVVFSISSSANPKTIYFSSDEEGLKIIADPLYKISSCSESECKDLDSVSE